MENESVNAKSRMDAAPVGKKSYDLDERTAQFGEVVTRFARTVLQDVTTIPRTSQFVRDGTSIRANYCKVDDAISAEDFRHRNSICKKEARETRFWPRTIAAAAPESKPPSRIQWREAKELHLIFSSTWRRRKS